MRTLPPVPNFPVIIDPTQTVWSL